MTSEYLNTKEAAAFIGVSIPTLWRWEMRLKGFPKPTRIGRLTRYKRSELEAFMKSNSETEG